MSIQQRITLKSLKVAKFASEETLCFTATVLFDGKPIAHARNDGTGGCALVQPMQGMRALLEAAEAYAQSLPPEVTDYPDPADPSGRMTFSITLEDLVDELANRMHADKQYRARFNRDIRNKVILCKAGELFSLRRVKLASIKDKATFFAKLRKQHGDDIVILNELSRDEALAVWEKCSKQEA